VATPNQCHPLPPPQVALITTFVFPSTLASSPTADTQAAADFASHKEETVLAQSSLAWFQLRRSLPPLTTKLSFILISSFSTRYPLYTPIIFILSGDHVLKDDFPFSNLDTPW